MEENSKAFGALNKTSTKFISNGANIINTFNCDLMHVFGITANLEFLLVFLIVCQEINLEDKHSSDNKHSNCNKNKTPLLCSKNVSNFF